MYSGRGQKGAAYQQQDTNEQAQAPPRSQRGGRNTRGGRGGGNQERDSNRAAHQDSNQDWEMPPQGQSKKGGWQEYKGQGAPGQAKPTKQGGQQQSAQPQNQKNIKKANTGGQNNQVSEEKKEAGANDSAQAFQYKEHKTLSNLKLVALSNQGPQLYSLDCQNTTSSHEVLTKEEDFPEYLTADIAKFSPINGASLAVVDHIGIHIVDVESKKELLKIERKGIIALEWTPKETYVISCEKQKPNENNLKVWDAKSGELVLQFEWKNTAKEGPKSIKFDEEEKFCARQVGKNLIEIYEGGNFKETKFQIVSKLPPLPKVDGQIQEDHRDDNSKFDGCLFCPMPPENKGSSNSPYYFMAWQNGEVLSEYEDNGLVYVYDLNSALQRPKFNIACPKAQNIQVLPAPSGHAILVWSQNLNDSSGKSYYGEHSLQYVRIHKGKNRHFIPVFDNQVQDVVWTPSGQEFIVVSGQQPATATMYNVDGQPTFEFGKRFRNTIRICPFGHSLIIGGFGNITKGEMDFWNLDQKKEVSAVKQAKSPCATRIAWSACGRYILTSVLYERLKVDNGFQIFRANGTKVLLKSGETFPELHFAEWQPHEYGVLSKPNIEKLRKEELKEEGSKPKKFFKFGGGRGGSANGAFQQMMRQNMASNNLEKGPKKVDANQYKELQDIQTAKAQQIIQSQATTNASSQAPSTKMNEGSSGAGVSSGTNNTGKNQKANMGAKSSGMNWRQGNFQEDNDEYYSEQYAHDEGSSGTYAQNMASQMKVEEKTLSKHAARRQKKKNKGGGTVVSDYPEPQPGGPIMGEAEPTLDDL